MKILFAYSDWAYNKERKQKNTYGGVGYYRTIKPAQYCSKEHTVVGKQLRHYGKSLEEQWDNIFKEFDVFWTSYFSDGELASAMFYHAQKHGKKVVIDCDDNFLDVPDSNPLCDTFKQGKKDRALTSTVLSFADVIVTSTKPLKQRIQGHIKAIHGIDKKVVVLPNMNDLKDWQYPTEKRDNFAIGYAGSNSHQDDLKMVLPSIARVLEKHDVVLELLGTIEKDKIGEYFNNISQEARNKIHILPASATFNDYPLWLSAQSWDIGIAPLVDTAFTRCKSHIKYLEYSALKIPTIASRVYPYFMEINGKPVITDDTGVLVRNNEWEGALEDLILNEKKRKQLGENAYNHVKENWQYPDKVCDEVLKSL